MTRYFALLLLVTALVINVSVRAEETKKDGREVDIPPDKLPENIAKAATDAVPGGKIADIDRDIKAGKSTWQIGVDAGGKTIEVVIDDDGKVLSKVEVQSEKINRLIYRRLSPTASRRVPHGKVTSAEKLTKGAATFFEMDIDADKKTFEVVFSADGKLVSKAQASEDEGKGGE